MRCSGIYRSPNAGQGRIVPKLWGSPFYSAPKTYSESLHVMLRSNLSLAARIDESVRFSGGMACVGLDPNRELMPPMMGVAEFNRGIVGATADAAAAYKLQLAFYESEGSSGIAEMEATIRYVRDAAPHAILIGDAKRCDVGHTAKAYAKALFETWGFDAATVVPYAGEDGLLPFLDWESHGIFVVCRTSNPSAHTLQDLSVAMAPPGSSNKKLYEKVADLAAELNTKGNTGIVAGSTYPEEMLALRKQHPDMPFLIPGTGSQGGDIAAAARAGVGETGFRGLINASRSIIYASSERSKFERAAQEACFLLRDATSTSVPEL